MPSGWVPGLYVSQIMKTKKLHPPRIAWALFIIFVAYSILYVIGWLTPRYSPNPILKGRYLSEWASDLKGYGWEDDAHLESVSVLKENKEFALERYRRKYCNYCRLE
jgi:hypothetical protein